MNRPVSRVGSSPDPGTHKKGGLHPLIFHNEMQHPLFLQKDYVLITAPRMQKHPDAV